MIPALLRRIDPDVGILWERRLRKAQERARSEAIHCYLDLLSVGVSEEEARQTARSLWLRSMYGEEEQWPTT